MVQSGVQHYPHRPSPLLWHVARHTNSSLSLQPSFTSRCCLYPLPGASFLAGSSVQGQKLNQAPRRREKIKVQAVNVLPCSKSPRTKRGAHLSFVLYNCCFLCFISITPRTGGGWATGCFKGAFPRSMLMKPKQITTKNHFVRFNYRRQWMLL